MTTDHLPTVFQPAAQAASVPALIARDGERAAYRFLEFFTAQIRNANTRRAYAHAVGGFCQWLDDQAMPSISVVTSVHIATYIEALGRDLSAPTVKQHLAAIRMMFDWLTTGGIIPFNPAAAVRGPKHSAKRGKTQILTPEEARQLIDSIDVTTPIGLRDRALIGLMSYTFARVGAALGMRVEDVYTQDRRLWVRLLEKGGKRHEMPCHHNLETYLHAYIDGCGLAADPRGPLFRTIGRLKGRPLTRTPLAQAEAYDMIARRAAAIGIAAKIGNHSFRATGITAYLKNGGTLERAATMANHASTRTTQLYDRRPDDVTLDEVERILI
jgi:site-specific recombinase XerD